MVEPLSPSGPPARATLAVEIAAARLLTPSRREAAIDDGRTANAGHRIRSRSACQGPEPRRDLEARVEVEIGEEALVGDRKAHAGHEVIAVAHAETKIDRAPVQVSAQDDGPWARVDR